MSRPIRFIPHGGALVEVTCRTVHSRFLLSPKGDLNTIVRGILARAARLYGPRICACAFLSNHYHLLLWVQDAEQLSRFMGYLNSNLAREAGRLADWREKFWSSRYRAIVVSDEEAAQVERLRYVLSHGAKEGLVARPRDWPGVHCVEELLSGKPVEGFWFDRTREHTARRRGEEVARLQYATPETVDLAPLPCWRHLPDEVWRSHAAELVAATEAEAAARQETTGIEPLGPMAIHIQHPHQRPMRTKRSRAPLFHAASRAVRRQLYEAYAWQVKAFRAAALSLRAGHPDVAFPPGCFPPGLPFVRA